MFCLYAHERQLPSLREAVERASLVDATLQPPFLGRVVIWCQTAATREKLVEAGAYA